MDLLANHEIKYIQSDTDAKHLCHSGNDYFSEWKIVYRSEAETVIIEQVFVPYSGFLFEKDTVKGWRFSSEA